MFNELKKKELAETEMEHVVAGVTEFDAGCAMSQHDFLCNHFDAKVFLSLSKFERDEILQLPDVDSQRAQLMRFSKGVNMNDGVNFGATGKW